MNAQEKKVLELTMNIAANMQLAIKLCFVSVHRLTGHFHVQKLDYDNVTGLQN